MNISGKEIAAEIKTSLKEKIELMKQNSECLPALAIAIAGNDEASLVYSQSAKKACDQIGIPCSIEKLPEDVNQDELITLIQKLNSDNSITGILVQLPLPAHIDKFLVIDAIDPKKDVDGFHPVNIGNLSLGRNAFVPSTPYGIMELIDHYKIELSGKNCVIIGRSDIVGKPLARLFTHRNATVTLCHTKTRNLSDITKTADIVAVATGKINTLTGDMLKEGAVVIDVGINRTTDNKLCGDADFESCSKVASAITPVPGGVGAMTIAMLLKNCVYGMSQKY